MGGLVSKTLILIDDPISGSLTTSGENFDLLEEAVEGSSENVVENGVDKRIYGGAEISKPKKHFEHNLDNGSEE